MKVFILVLQLFFIICICKADDLDPNNIYTPIRPSQVTVEVEPLRSDCHRLLQRIYTPSHHGSCASLISTNNNTINVFIESMRVRGPAGGGGTCAFFSALPNQIRNSPALSGMQEVCNGSMRISARFTEDNLCSFNNALKNMSPLEALRQTPFDKGLRKGLKSQYRICDVEVDPTSGKVIYSVEPIGSASSSSAPRPTDCSPGGCSTSTKPEFRKPLPVNQSVPTTNNGVRSHSFFPYCEILTERINRETNGGLSEACNAVTNRIYIDPQIRLLAQKASNCEERISQRSIERLGVNTPWRIFGEYCSWVATTANNILEGRHCHPGGA